MKASIITVSLNNDKTIGDTIKSVLNQTYSSIEYIVIDGGSIDETKNIIASFGDKINIFVSEKDNGIYDAMNKGISLATGDIIGILNTDDVYFDNDVIKNVIEGFQRTNCDTLWGNIVYVKRDDLNVTTRTWLSSPYSPGCFQKGWHPPHTGFFVKRSVYEKYGLFRTDLSIAADYEFMLRVLEKEKISSSFLNKTLVKMRDGGESNWRNVLKVAKGNHQSSRAWKILGLPKPMFFVFKKPLGKIKQLFKSKR